MYVAKARNRPEPADRTNDTQGLRLDSPARFALTHYARIVRRDATHHVGVVIDRVVVPAPPQDVKRLADSTHLEHWSAGMVVG
jgi:hypothetical protein